jgi:hypothetical protein
MRKTFLTAFAAASVLSVGMLSNAAGAMTFVAPAPISVTARDTGLVQEAALHCDWGGFFFAFTCWRYPDYSGYYRPHRYGWHHRRGWHHRHG